jgi:hypothetical protein
VFTIARIKVPSIAGIRFDAHLHIPVRHVAASTAGIPGSSKRSCAQTDVDICHKGAIWSSI